MAQERFAFDDTFLDNFITLYKNAYNRLKARSGAPIIETVEKRGGFKFDLNSVAKSLGLALVPEGDKTLDLQGVYKLVEDFIHTLENIKNENINESLKRKKFLECHQQFVKDCETFLPSGNKRTQENKGVLGLGPYIMDFFKMLRQAINDETHSESLQKFSKSIYKNTVKDSGNVPGDWYTKFSTDNENLQKNYSPSSQVIPGTTFYSPALTTNTSNSSTPVFTTVFNIEDQLSKHHNVYDTFIISLLDQNGVEIEGDLVQKTEGIFPEFSILKNFNDTVDASNFFNKQEALAKDLSEISDKPPVQKFLQMLADELKVEPSTFTTKGGFETYSRELREKFSLQFEH